MADTNNRDVARRSEQQNHQQQHTQEYKKRYSTKKGAGYGGFGGFIAAISFTGIMLYMPFIFHFPEGTFIYTLGTTVTGIKSDPVISGIAGFAIILIQGIVVGIIFGVVTSKVKTLHPSHKKKGVGLGLATGIIAFLVLYLPVMLSVYPQLLGRAFTSYPTAELTTRGIQSYNNMIISSSYPKYLPGILGLGIFAYLVYGALMGGIVTLAYSVYNFDLMKMKEKERQEKEEGKKAKDEKNQKWYQSTKINGGKRWDIFQLLSNEVLVWFGKNIRSYILMIIFGTLIVTSLQPDLLAATEKDLASHMVLEHTLFFFLGAISVQVAETVLRLIVSFENTKRKSRSQTGAQERKSNLTLKIISIWSQSLRKIFIVNNRYGFIWLIIPIILLTFWHLPSIFDYAALNEQVHIIQHISFIIVGATAFLALRALGESFKILILVSLNAIMAFAGLMFAVTSTPIYPVYSVSSHNDAGTYMLITCILLLLVVLPTYLIHRTILHVRVKTINNSNRWQQGLE